MRRPSFQFYPADWQSNIKLRRCNFNLKGIWLEVMCLLHDSDKYGLLKWPLQEIANCVKCDKKELEHLITYGILKGSDKDGDKVSFSDTFSQRKGHPIQVMLIDDVAPLWFSSRMVRDEYIRNKRGEGGIKSLENNNVPRKKEENCFTDKVSLSPSFSPSPTVDVDVDVVSSSSIISLKEKADCKEEKENFLLTAKGKKIKKSMIKESGKRGHK